MNTAFQDAFPNILSLFEERKYGVHSIMVQQHGKLLGECFWTPHEPEDAHMLNSLSKSFTSIGVLFAMQEGLLDADDYLTEIFPGYDCCENMKKMRVRHLLTMSTGHKPNADFIFGYEDCVSAFMTSDVPHEPGSFFLYNTAATYMLSAIVMKLTGQPVYEYLRPRFFEPLGIDGFYWESCPRGIPYGGFGLYVRTGDILRLGQFLLNGGSWDGRQLLSPSLIARASSMQIDNTGNGAGDWGVGYGWQFWRCVPDGVYRGDGAFGQYCIVLPHQDAVIATTAAARDMHVLIELIWEELLPSLEQDAHVGEPLILRRPLPTAKGEASGIPGVCGVRYQLEKNPLGLTGFTVKENGEVIFTTSNTQIPVYAVRAANRGWSFNETGWREKPLMPGGAGLLNRFSASYGWTGSTLHLTLVGRNSAFTQTVAIEFAGPGRPAVMKFSQDIGMKEMQIRASILEREWRKD